MNEGKDHENNSQLVEAKATIKKLNHRILVLENEIANKSDNSGEELRTTLLYKIEYLRSSLIQI